MQTAMLDGLVAPDSATIQAVLEGVAHYAYAIARAEPGLSGEPIPGVDPRFPVRSIVVDDLMVLISDVSLAEYDLGTLRERLQNSVWLELLARGHQRVMTALLERYTLLPLKLCTLYTDEVRVRELLETSGTWFRSALERIAGAREWGVKVFCARPTLSAWAAKAAPELRSLAESVGAASPGARYMLEKRLQRAAQLATDDLRRQHSEEIAATLASGPWAAQRGAIQPAQVHGRLDDMVLNGAYLVSEGELEHFRATLDGLAAEYGPRGYSVVLTGPWPAYSFSGQLEPGEA
jgi:hypothetical protein